MANPEESLTAVSSFSPCGYQQPEPDRRASQRSWAGLRQGLKTKKEGEEEDCTGVLKISVLTTAAGYLPFLQSCCQTCSSFIHETDELQAWVKWKPKIKETCLFAFSETWQIGPGRGSKIKWVWKPNLYGPVTRDYQEEPRRRGVFLCQ